MKTIIAQTLSTVFILAAFAAFLWVLYYSLKLWGQKTAAEAQEYEDLYFRTQSMIHTLPVTVDNYELIYGMLEKLLLLKYKDDELNQVLFQSFDRTYAEIAEKVAKDIGN